MNRSTKAWLWLVTALALAAFSLGAVAVGNLRAHQVVFGQLTDGVSVNWGLSSHYGEDAQPYMHMHSTGEFEFYGAYQTVIAAEDSLIPGDSLSGLDTIYQLQSGAFGTVVRWCGDASESQAVCSISPWGFLNVVSPNDDTDYVTANTYGGRLVIRSAIRTCAGGTRSGMGCDDNTDCPSSTCSGTYTGPILCLEAAVGIDDPIGQVFCFNPTGEMDVSDPDASTSASLDLLGDALWGGESGSGTELVSDGCLWFGGIPGTGRSLCMGNAPDSADCNSSTERGNLWVNVTNVITTLSVCQGDGIGGQSWVPK